MAFLLKNVSRQVVPAARTVCVRRASAGKVYEGHLFGEKPLAAGESRKWQSWEAPYYFSMTAAAVVLYFGLAAKPDSDLRTWARIKALEQVAEEDEE